MTVPALRLQHVVQGYGQTSVLRGVNLELHAGECFGLVGVNGAGKTSLIKCVLDFCALDGGAIDIFGQPHHRPASRQPLGFLPERFTPPYYLTGADFIRYLLTLQGLRYDAAVECAKIEHAFDQAGLAGAVDAHQAEAFTRMQL